MDTFTFDTTQPATGTAPSQSQPIMQTNNLSTYNMLAVDHITFNNTSGGQHKQITFNSNNVPSVPTSHPTLFTNIANGISQLFFYSGSAQQSSNQYYFDSGPNNEGSTFLLGGIIMKWGTVTLSTPFQTINFQVQFPNHCFVVLTQPINSNAVALLVTGENTSGFTTSFGNDATYYYCAIGN